MNNINIIDYNNSKIKIAPRVDPIILLCYTPHLQQTIEEAIESAIILKDNLGVKEMGLIFNGVFIRMDKYFDVLSAVDYYHDMLHCMNVMWMSKDKNNVDNDNKLDG